MVLMQHSATILISKKKSIAAVLALRSRRSEIYEDGGELSKTSVENWKDEAKSLEPVRLKGTSCPPIRHRHEKAVCDNDSHSEPRSRFCFGRDFPNMYICVHSKSLHVIVEKSLDRYSLAPFDRQIGRRVRRASRRL